MPDNKYEDWGEACARGDEDLVFILVGIYEAGHCYDALRKPYFANS